MWTQDSKGGKLIMTQPINPEIASVQERLMRGLTFQCVCKTEEQEQHIKECFKEQAEIIHSIEEAWFGIGFMIAGDPSEI